MGNVSEINELILGKSLNFLQTELVGAHHRWFSGKEPVDF